MILSDEQKVKRFVVPRYAINKLSFAGFVMLLFTAGTMVVALALAAIIGESNPYMGIFVYMVLPFFLLIGMGLILIGMYFTRRKVKRLGDEAIPRRPRIDLSKSAHRNTMYMIIAGVLFYIVLSVVGSYGAYHHSESVEFCGETCHVVMEPERVAYRNSTHARVACTACHVGPGAGWYAKSKLSGAYQVYAVLTDKFPRPIPTPIDNLRPAQETCEQCHWPEKFFGAQQRIFDHYMYDKENTYWPINMLIKTGGGSPTTGHTSGIHWHMNIQTEVEYIARDEKRQDIPWIRITDRQTGRVTIYQNDDDPLTDEEIAAAVPRKMDCMDCHNRPSHKFRSPTYAVDYAISTGAIDRSIPEIKRVAEQALIGDYATREEAEHGIANTILTFYLNNYPDFNRENIGLIDQAVAATQYQYSQNFFPEMKVRWDEYPDNIGHFISPGCMRCHTGSHRSSDGRELTRDCRACHAIIAQGTGDRAQMAVNEEGLDFEHPEDIDDAWKEIGCFECHTGTQP